MHHPVKQLLLTGVLSLIMSGAAANGLHDFNGKASSLEAYTGKGKWTIVMIWASDCHVCNEEAQQYEGFHRLHHAKDAMVLGIALDGLAKKDDAGKFIRRHKLSFPNLIGEREIFLPHYMAISGKPWIGTPTIMVYAPDGELRGAQAGAVPVDIIETFIRQESAGAAGKQDRTGGQ